MGKYGKRALLHDSIWVQIGRQGATYGSLVSSISIAPSFSSAHLFWCGSPFIPCIKSGWAEPAGLRLGHKRGIERQRSSGDGSCFLSSFSFFSCWSRRACSRASAAVQRWKSFIGPQCDENTVPVSINSCPNHYARPLLMRTLRVLSTYDWRSISQTSKAPITDAKIHHLIRYARCSRPQRTLSRGLLHPKWSSHQLIQLF